MSTTQFFLQTFISIHYCINTEHVFWNDSPLFFYISTKKIDLWLNMLIFQRFLVLDFSIVNILIVINYAKPAFACSYFRPKFFFKLFSKKMSVSDGPSFLANLNSFSLDCRSSFMLVLFTEINIFSSFT